VYKRLIFPLYIHVVVVDSAFNAVHEGVDVQGREGDYVLAGV